MLRLAELDDELRNELDDELRFEELDEPRNELDDELLLLFDDELLLPLDELTLVDEPRRVEVEPPPDTDVPFDVEEPVVNELPRLVDDELEPRKLLEELDDEELEPRKLLDELDELTDEFSVDSLRVKRSEVDVPFDLLPPAEPPFTKLLLPL